MPYRKQLKISQFSLFDMNSANRITVTDQEQIQRKEKHLFFFDGVREELEFGLRKKENLIKLLRQYLLAFKINI